MNEYERLTQLENDFYQASSAGIKFAHDINASSLSDQDKQLVQQIYLSTHTDVNKRLLDELRTLRNKLGR